MRSFDSSRRDLQEYAAFGPLIERLRDWRFLENQYPFSALEEMFKNRYLENETDDR